MLRFLLACTVIVLTCTSLRAAAAVNDFDIIVPRKTASGQLPIYQLRVIVRMADAGAVNFSATDPTGVTQALSPTPLSPGSALVVAAPFGAGIANASGPDVISVESPTVAVGGFDGNADPSNRNYVLNITLGTDRQSGGSNNMAGDETWQIVKTAGPAIEGVVVQSFDLNVPGHENNWIRVVPNTEPVARVTPDQLTQGGGRPPVDVMLVLDRSGSMGDAVLGMINPDRTKIAALRSAVQDFVDIWQSLRLAEMAYNVAPTPDAGANPIPDRIGAVCFDHDMDSLKDLVPASAMHNTLLPFTEALRNDIFANIASVNPGGATSIGGGLLQAVNTWSAADFVPGNGHRKVILLMSDGMQNTDPMVQVMSPATPAMTVQTTVGGTPTPLPHEADLQIYSVTVGTDTAVNADINDNLAKATRGYYLNTETSAEPLRPFFVQLLQNFIRFNTVETVTMISGRMLEGGPAFSADFPVASVSRSVHVLVMWQPGHGMLGLTVTPPGGTPVPAVPVGPGSARASILLPVTGSTPGARWKINVTASQQWKADIPFDVIVLSDDSGLKSDLGIVPRDYKPGDQIEIRATVREFGATLTTLGSGATVRAKILKPGASIGDLLSDSTAPSTQPESPDRLSDAGAKLANLLAANPGALAQAEGTVDLRDDGANGDGTAGDGIFTGLLPAPEVGHYHFLIGVEGETPRIGKFSRMQMRSVHARAVPDDTATQVQSAVVALGGGTALAVTLTPRTKTGRRIGPGWGGYYWLLPTGGQPIAAVDQLNGTYTASIPFTGGTPPAVAVKFVDVLAVIPPNATADKLPIPLATVPPLIPQIPAPGQGNAKPTGALPWWVWLLIAIAILVLIVFLAAKRKSGP